MPARRSFIRYGQRVNVEFKCRNSALTANRRCYSRYRVLTIPTVLILDRGGQVVSRFEGEDPQTVTAFALSLRGCISQHHECPPQSQPSAFGRQSPCLASRPGRRCSCWDESLLPGSLPRSRWGLLFSGGTADPPGVRWAMPSHSSWESRSVSPRLASVAAYVGRIAEIGTPAKYAIASFPYSWAYIAWVGSNSQPSRPKAFQPRLRWGVRDRASAVTRHWAVRNACPCVGSILRCVQAELRLWRLLLFLYGLGRCLPLVLSGYGRRRSPQEFLLQPLWTLDSIRSSGVHFSCLGLISCGELNRLAWTTMSTSGGSEDSGRMVGKPYLIALREESPINREQSR